MLEKVFFNILNFPYIVSQEALSINMIVSITILIALILFVRLILRKTEDIKIICVLYFLVPLRVVVEIIWGYSATETTPECIASVNHWINQSMTYIQQKWESGTGTVQPATFVLEAVSLPGQIKWIWLIGSAGVLLLLLFVYFVKGKSDKENRVRLPFDGIRIIMLALFWFHPLMWMLVIASRRDERSIRENPLREGESDRKKRGKGHWIRIWVIAIALVVTMFTSFPHVEHLDGEQTIKQFYYYLDQEYAGGLRQLYPMGEGDFKEGKRTDEVKKIIQMNDVTNDSEYQRYRGHTTKFAERKVIAVDVTRCAYDVSHGGGDKKQTKQDTDVFEIVKRSVDGEWEIVYWSEGNWGYGGNF